MRRTLALVMLAPLAANLASCQSGTIADGARAHARVVKQVEMGPRIPGTPGHAAFRRWLTSELARLGATVEEQRGTDTTLGRPIEIVNMIGRYGPASGRPLLLCAHYDTRPMADRDPDPARQGEPVPGANDGASGVAVLLEVAEALAKRPPKVAIHLVFFDAEDLGAALAPQEFCLGSKLYASKLPPAGDPSRPRAAVLFDLVGDRDLNIHPERNSAERAANLVAIIGTAAKATGAKRFHDDPKYPVTDDHLPLLDAGIPAADVIDLDYDAWHTTRDLPDRVSAESLAEVSRVAIWLATRSAFSRP